MTKKTNQRRRHRAVFLAFIMVVSVFGGAIAFSGSAVADQTSASSDAVDQGNSAGTSPGEAVNFTDILFNASDSGNGATITAVRISSSGFDGNNVSSIRVFNNSTGQLLGTNASVDRMPSNVSFDQVGSVNIPASTDPNTSFNYTVEVTFDSDARLVNSTTTDFQSASFNQTAGNVSQNPASLTNEPINVGNVTVNNFEQFRSDERVNLNVSITTPRDNPNDVNESTIDLNVAKNPNAGLNQTNISVVQGGSLNSDVLQDNGTSFDDNGNVSINVDIPLPETGTVPPAGGYNVTLASPVEDDGGNVINTTGNISRTNPSEGNISVDMRPDEFNLVPNNSNPFIDTDPSDSVLASEGADLRLTVVDRFGNNLTRNDSDIQNRLVANNITTSTSNTGLTTSLATDTNGNPPDPLNDTVLQGRPLFVNASSTTAGDFAIDVLDTGSGNAVIQDSATQTFSARVGGVAATANRTTLPAVFSEQARIETQLTDGNGTDVPRSGVTISYAISNSSDAGVTRNNTLTTNSSGTATLNISATNAGETLEITAIEQSTGNGFRDTATIDTVPGDISAGNSVFKINGNTQPGNDITSAGGVQVDTQHTLNITLLDSNNNLAPNTPVTLSANQSGASFESTSLTTNETGTATTTVTLPETVTTTRINVSAGGFNASATGDASINVTSVAANATALQFASDTRSLPTNQDDVGVTVEVVDTFDNVNTTVTDSVTLTSDDTAVFDFDGSESSSVNLGSGTADFSVDVGESGTATLSATTADSDINNTSAEFTSSGPASIDVTFSSDVSTSSNANTNSTATLQAQLVDSDGSEIGIVDETISFARQTGSAAELNESDAVSGSFEATTNSNGAATFGINATDTEGETTFLAVSDNFSAQGTGTVTTTGAVSTINITTADSTIDRNNTTTVTTIFEDGSGRAVPRIDSIRLQPENGSVTGSPNTTQFVNGDAQATFTYNGSTTDSSVDLTAVGGSVTGDATVTVEQQEQLPDRSITFDDKTVGNTSTDITVESATFNGSQSFNVVVHEATDDNGDGTIQPSEIGQKIGESVELDNGTQTDITVNISKQVDPDDDVDQLTESQTLVAMLHTTNTSDDDGIVHTAPIREDGTQNTPPVFDDANITVSPLEGTTGDFDSNADGEIDINDISDAAAEFIDGDLSIQEISRIAAEFLD